MTVPVRARRRLYVAIVIGFAMLLPLVGGSVEAGSAAQARDAQAQLPTFRLSYATYATRYTDIFIAAYQGFFRRAGVNVVLDNNGTQFQTTTLARQTDASISGATTVVPLKGRGLDMKVIYTTNYGNSGGYIVKADSRFRRVMDLSGASVGTTLTGQSFGQANALSNYIVRRGGRPLEIKNISLPPGGGYGDLVAGGVIDTANVDASAAAPYIAAGKVRWLQDGRPRSPIMKATYPDNVVGISIWGFDDHFKENRDVVRRFVAGLRMAERWMARKNNRVIAQILMSAQPNFAAVGRPALMQSLTFDRQIWATKQEGFISPAAWRASLPVWNDWKTGQDVFSPPYNHSSLVDMSYWRAATPIVNRLFPKVKR